MSQKPSERIEELARKRLDKEKAKGMFFFPEGMHAEALLEAIIDYLDEIEKQNDLQTLYP